MTANGQARDAAGAEWGRALTALTLVVAVFVGLVQQPGDDGLRHVGLAFGGGRPWGEVYPHSAFAQYPGYDPWWGFDLTLRGLAALLGLLPLSRLTGQFLAVKALACAFAAAFLLLAVRRAGLREQVRSPSGLVAAGALIALFLSLPLSRILTIRPFALGSLYLLFALPGGGVVRGAAAAGALAFFYPYLFWVYTLPVAAAHLLRGERRYGVAAAIATVAAVAVQPREFWGMLRALAQSDGIRAALETKIVELSPGTGEPLLLLLLVLAAVCLPPFLSPAARRLGVPHLLMLFYLPVSVKYVRYLVDVPPVLLFVIAAPCLANSWAAQAERVGRYWRERIGAAAGGGVPPGGTEGVAAPRGATLRPWIALAAAALAVLIVVIAVGRERDLRSLERALREIPAGSLVLTEFNTQYALLFVRPDLRIVPSCEIGFPDAAIREPYLRFFNEGDPCTLAAVIGAGHFVSGATMVLAPDRVQCLERTGAAATGAYRQLVVWKTGAVER